MQADQLIEKMADRIAQRDQLRDTGNLPNSTRERILLARALLQMVADTNRKSRPLRGQIGDNS